MFDFYVSIFLKIRQCNDPKQSYNHRDRSIHIERERVRVCWQARTCLHEILSLTSAYAKLGHSHKKQIVCALSLVGWYKTLYVVFTNSCMQWHVLSMCIIRSPWLLHDIFPIKYTLAAKLTVKQAWLQRTGEKSFLNLNFAPKTAATSSQGHLVWHLRPLLLRWAAKKYRRWWRQCLLLWRHYLGFPKKHSQVSN